MNPFSRLAAGPTAEQRIGQAALIAAGDLAAADGEWFGWPPSDTGAGRYMLVGFLAGEGDHRHGRGYLVDVVSGHVLWQRELNARSDLPRTMAAVTEE